MHRYFLAMILSAVVVFPTSGNDCHCTVPDTALVMSISYENWDGSSWYCNEKGNWSNDEYGRIVEKWIGCDSNSRYDQTLYSYSDGMLIKLNVHENTIDAFSFTSREITSYHPDTDTTTFQTFYDDEWVNVRREIVIYHNASKTLQKEKTFENWNGTDWIGSARYIYEYTAFDSLAIFTHYFFDNSTNQYKPIAQSIYAYDSLELKIEYITKSGSSDTLVNFQRETYSYDNKNRLSETNYYNWDAASSSWSISSKMTYTYEVASQRLVTTITGQQWTGNEFQISFVQIDTANSCGKLLSQLNFREESGQLVPNYRRYYEYDCFGNLITNTQQHPDGSGWINIDRSVITYSYLFNRASLVYPKATVNKTGLKIDFTSESIILRGSNDSKYMIAELFDLRGRMIRSEKIKFTNNQTSIPFQKNQIANAHYFIRLKDSKGSVIWNGRLSVFK